MKYSAEALYLADLFIAEPVVGGGTRLDVACWTYRDCGGDGARRVAMKNTLAMELADYIAMSTSPLVFEELLRLRAALEKAEAFVAIADDFAEAYGNSTSHPESQKVITETWAAYWEAREADDWGGQ